MVPKKNDIQYNIHKIKLFLFVIKFTMVDFKKIWFFLPYNLGITTRIYFTFYFLRSYTLFSYIYILLLSFIQISLENVPFVLLIFFEDQSIMCLKYICLQSTHLIERVIF